MTPLPERVTLTLTAVDIARIQIERAIQLFLDGEDYVSATTLAGAGEAILGDILRARDIKHALDEIVDDSILVGQKLYPKEVMTRKGIISLANSYRDRLKHLNDGSDINVSVDYEAACMIERACDNYAKVTGDETEIMDKFRMFEYFGPNAVDHA